MMTMVKNSLLVGGFKPAAAILQIPLLSLLKQLPGHAISSGYNLNMALRTHIIHASTDGS